MKKILYIIPYIPYPLTSGGNQAFFSMIEYLRHRFEVSILLYPKTRAQESNLKELRKEWSNVAFFIFREVKAPQVCSSFYYKLLKKIKKTVDRKIKRQLLYANKDVLRNKSTLFSSAFTPLNKEYAEYVSSVAKQGFDLIQVEFYELLSLGYLLPDDVETIFVHHELRYIRNENEMALFDKPNEEEKMLLEVAKDFEHSALQRYNHIIVLTETDRKILSGFMGRKERIYASPAVINLPVISIDKFVPATYRLTFIGGEDHFPNLDAVMWFCQEIAPCLRSQGIHFTFQVVGHWHSFYAKELIKTCSELELVGYVDNLQAFLQGSISIVPIRIGSGMRMKILDAVSSLTPFVTTPKGVEGIDLRNEEECLIADTTTNFTDAITRLIRDEDLQKRLATQADLRFRTLYKSQEMLDKRLAIYNQVLKG